MLKYPLPPLTVGDARISPCYIRLMNLLINGQPRTFPDLASGASVQELLAALGLKQDRVAVEHNGAIVSRPAWPTASIADGDQFEIVHFVGGGRP